jgi:molybdopterin synthase catalytic subunit
MKALLFARLRELAGTESAEASGATVREAWESLRRRFPGLPADPGGIRAARNQDFVEWDAALAPGDEVAFIPPVSGGSETGVFFELTTAVLDPRRLEAAVAHPGAGAICTFTGVVRDNSRGQKVQRLEYEAYAGMAEKQMREIAAEIGERWSEARVAMAHRTGPLEIGEASVVVSVSCPHRAEAIAACKHGIDRLKESVPIWKKEFAEGGAVWIEGPNATPGPPTPRP